MKISDLIANPENPRKVSEDRLKMLKDSLDAFGDLGGIIINKNTGHIVSGHQRVKSLPPDAEIEITGTFHEPTSDGTVEVGYIKVSDKWYSYRAVMWDIPTEKAAMIRANKAAGEWDFQILPDLLLDLDSNNIDLDLTGFDKKELDNILAPTEIPDPKEELNVKDEFILAVDCKNEENLKSLYEKLISEGYECKLIT